MQHDTQTTIITNARPKKLDANKPREKTPEQIQQELIDMTMRKWGKFKADPVNGLGRKKFSREAGVVFFQVFKNAEVIGHIERPRRMVYRCFVNGRALGIKLNITTAIKLVMQNTRS